MSRTRPAALASSAVAAAVLSLAGPTATSATAAAGCPSGYVCVHNASGSGHAFWKSDPDFADDLYADGSSVDDNVVSVTNSSNREAHFHLGPGYAGFLFCVNPGSQVHGLSATGASSLLLRTETSIPCY